MKIIKAIKIYMLKQTARKYLLLYRELQGRYDCGNLMIDSLTGGKLSGYRKGFETAMERLKELDPEAYVYRGGL